VDLLCSVHKCRFRTLAYHKKTLKKQIYLIIALDLRFYPPDVERTSQTLAIVSDLKKLANAYELIIICNVAPVILHSTLDMAFIILSCLFDLDSVCNWPVMLCFTRIQKANNKKV
jgi:hypothetical protein